MKICIIGAGAIGGMLGAKLAIAGNDVTFVEPNRAHGEAIARNGLRVVDHHGELSHVARDVKVTADIATPGPQDLVVIAVKAQLIPLVARTLKPLLGPETVVMTVQTAAAVAYNLPGRGPFGRGIVLALLFLPLLSNRKVREKLRGRMLLAFLLMAGLATAVTGCGGQIRLAPLEVHTLTVTATSGDLQHIQTVTLTSQ